MSFVGDGKWPPLKPALRINLILNNSIQIQKRTTKRNEGPSIPAFHVVFPGDPFYCENRLGEEEGGGPSTPSTTSRVTI